MNRYSDLKQGVSAFYKVTFVDEDSVAVPKANISTITMTLYDEVTGDIINSRNDTDVFDAGPGTVTTGGELTIALDPADMALVSTDVDCEIEWHVLLVKFTYSDGSTRTGAIEAALGVQRVTNIA